VPLPSLLQTKTKKEDVFFFFSSIRKQNKTQIKRKTIEKKMQKREGTYLSSPAFVFGMKLIAFFSPCSFNIELPTFLKPCVLCLLKALSYSSLGVLPGSGNGVSGK
jgi:hypothetical protein